MVSDNPMRWREKAHPLPKFVGRSPGTDAAEVAVRVGLPEGQAPSMR
jgi:hypothetical protein